MASCFSDYLDLSEEEEGLLREYYPSNLPLEVAALKDRYRAKNGKVHVLCWDEDETGWWPEDGPHPLDRPREEVTTE